MPDHDDYRESDPNALDDLDLDALSDSDEGRSDDEEWPVPETAPRPDRQTERRRRAPRGQQGDL